MIPTRIRSAEASDLRAITDLRVALWPDGSASEHEHEAAAIFAGKPRSTLPLVLFVAEEPSGRLLGFIEIGLRSHADGCDATRPVGFVEGWYVVPERRGCGVGRALMDSAEQWARERGCVELGSDTWADNEASVRAHEALGFEVVDRCVNFRKAIA